MKRQLVFHHRLHALAYRDRMILTLIVLKGDVEVVEMLERTGELLPVRQRHRHLAWRAGAAEIVTAGLGIEFHRLQVRRCQLRADVSEVAGDRVAGVALALTLEVCLPRLRVPGQYVPDLIRTPVRRQLDLHVKKLRDGANLRLG